LAGATVLRGDCTLSDGARVDARFESRG